MRARASDEPLPSPLREGAHLAVTAQATDELESLRREAESFGVRCVAVTADLAEEGAVDVVYSAARDALGPIQILVNNGVGSSANPKPVVNYDDDFWNLLLYVNLTVFPICSASACYRTCWLQSTGGS